MSSEFLRRREPVLAPAPGCPCPAVYPWEGGLAGKSSAPSLCQAARAAGDAGGKASGRGDG